MTRIITVNKYPPIPIRDFDWCAYHDGEEESGHYGWGKTEDEAIADLKRLDIERAEAALEERIDRGLEEREQCR